MSELPFTMWVALGAKQHHASRTDHEWIDSSGKHKFEPFFRLEIRQQAGESWCHLLRFSADSRPHGRIAESECETVEDALAQAEWEFGVRADEWQTVKQENPA